MLLRHVGVWAGGALLAVAVATGTPASAEPVNCQKQVIKNLLKFKKIYLKGVEKCLDKQNAGTLPGPCPDALTQVKIDTTKTKVRDKIAASCPAPDLSTLGFPATCAYEATGTGIEAACAALPVTGPAEFADCLMCWKGAELAEFMGTLYASHVSEICAGATDETSSACSELDCAVPLPDQRDLGLTGENDCQKAIGKAAVKHLVSVEKAQEKCGLLGNDRATCLGDPATTAAVAKSLLKLDAGIRAKCGNRDPVPSAPFCCKTGPGNMCMAATDRDDCTVNLGGTVQEGKTCDVGGSDACQPVGGGGQKITWWSTCPIDDVCSGSLDTLDELISCVDATVSEITHEMLCIQFPSGWGPCPADASPSGAFIVD